MARRFAPDTRCLPPLAPGICPGLGHVPVLRLSDGQGSVLSSPSENLPFESAFYPRGLTLKRGTGQPPSRIRKAEAPATRSPRSPGRGDV